MGGIRTYVPEDIDDLLDEPPAAPGELVARARENFEYEDPHDAMSWWACFVESGDEERPAADLSGEFLWDDPRFRQEEYVTDDHFDAWLDELIHRFYESPEAAVLLDLDGSFLDLILRLALDYEGVVPADIDSGTLQVLLLHLFPRKVSIDPNTAGALVREAEAFFRFAGREFGAERAEQCCRVLDERLAAELARRLGDPSRFGMAKSFFGAGKAAGFDMSSQQGLDAFVLAQNAARLAETEAALGRRDDVPRSDKKETKKKKKKRELAKKSRRRNR